MAGILCVPAVPVCLCLLLAAVTLAVYWPAVHGDFVDYDDPDYFYSNSHVQTGLSFSNFKWAWTTGLCANWHPLTWLSLMLDAEVFGEGPFGPHLTNLLFHAANTVLLFLLLRRLTAATWRSALVAALFALHPLHVESVAWVAERKDVLSTFFGLWSLWMYASYVSHKAGPATRFYLLSLFFFALSLMAKPMLVTLPFVMLLLDWWPLGRISECGMWISESNITPQPSTLSPLARRSEAETAQLSTLFLEKLPFFVLSAISCLVTFRVQHQGGAVAALSRFSLSARIGNAFVSYDRYLGKTFWPAGLATPYPYVEHWPWARVLSAVALFIGLSLVAVGLRRRFPFLFVGWFWFVGTLVPVIGLVQVGGQAMADRYSYVPLIGLFLILAWGGWEIGLRWPRLKPGLVLTAFCLLAVCLWLTRIQAAFWKNSGTLFQHTLSVTDNNYTACVDLGTWLSARGDVPGAVECYGRALQMNPSDPSVLYDLGNGFAKLGMWDDAITCYRKALEITPDQTDILNNLGMALTTKQQFAEAIVCFEAALKLDPVSASTHNNLAAVLFREHRLDEAVQHYRAALHATPDDPRIYVNLGDALLKLGQTAEAVTNYQAALRLNPGDVQVAAKLKKLGVTVSD